MDGMDIAEEIELQRASYRESRLRLQLPGYGWILGFICVLAALFLHLPEEQYFDSDEILLAPTETPPAVVEPEFNLVNLTDALEPIWQGCQGLLLNYNASESWFNEVEVNNELIATMVDAVPSSDEESRDDIDTPSVQRRMEQRIEDLARAKAMLKGFLNIRHQMILNLISNLFMWRQYAGRNEATEYLLQIAEGKNPVEPKAETTTYAQRLAYNLSEMLVDTWIPPIDYMIGHINAAYHYIALAAVTEKDLIDRLQAESAKAHIWNTERGRVGNQLLSDTMKLKLASADTKQALEVVKEGWPIINTLVTTPQEAFSLRAQIARDLIRNWAMVMMYSEEGILLTSRKHRCTKEAGGRPDSDRCDSDASWGEWKKRNCGGTSCYDIESSANKLRTKLSIDTKPYAGVAKDEVEWRATWKVPETFPKVLPETYEKACCVDDDLAGFLQYMPSKIIDTIRQTHGGQ
ncbi:hypothetical protein K449DRAFT_128128 [Hypoxylon sp. EC38]|nr:hypothetical protein K449DRAFT_128128 [Hypoxylon sp. EC38]